jgi:3-methyladenine DNA glycosylase AlkD
MEVKDIIRELEARADAKAVAGMARFGITGTGVYGISMPELIKLGKAIGRDHRLALELWALPGHESRILAALIDDPAQVTEAQMDAWVGDFDSWDVCDQAIMKLFEKTPFGWKKALSWSRAEEEFVKRAGFVMMARLAVSDKRAPDAAFAPFWPEIRRGATDPRNFVKKAVNWALRQIGKRNLVLNKAAVALAHELSGSESAAARWVAADALRELTSLAVERRLTRRA